MLKDGDVYWKMPDGTYKWMNGSMKCYDEGAEVVGIYQSNELKEKTKEKYMMLIDCIRNEKNKDI